MILTIMPVDDVPEGGVLRARLLELSFGYEIGQMMWRFGDAGVDDWIVIARGGETVVGWALVFKMYGRRNLHVFVDPNYRKCNVATAIIRVAVARSMPLYVTAQNEASWRLFARFKHGELIVIDERPRADYENEAS